MYTKFRKNRSFFLEGGRFFQQNYLRYGEHLHISDTAWNKENETWKIYFSDSSGFPMSHFLIPKYSLLECIKYPHSWKFCLLQFVNGLILLCADLSVFLLMILIILPINFSVWNYGAFAQNTWYSQLNCKEIY